MANKYEKNSGGEGNNVFSFCIHKTYAQIGERKQSGFRKELNYVSFQNGKAKWDLREWNDDHTKMSRGMTFTDEEFADLCSACEEIMNQLAISGVGVTNPKRPEKSSEKLEIINAARNAHAIGTALATEPEPKLAEESQCDFGQESETELKVDSNGVILEDNNVDISEDGAEEEAAGF